MSPSGNARLTGEGERRWTDPVRDRLLEQRVVVVSGRLDDETAGEVVVQLMTLDALGDAPVTLALSSAGGALEASMGVVDVVEALGVPVHATAIGRLEGPPVGILAVAARRYVAPHARLRLCGDEIVCEGPARHLEAVLADHEARLRALAVCIGRRASRGVEEIVSDIAAGRYLSAEEAVRYGIVDEVLQPDATVLRIRGFGGGSTFGFRPSGPVGR